MDEQHETPLAEVRYLPLEGAGEGPTPAGEVLEGEVLTAEEYGRIFQANALARRAEYRRTAVTAVQHASYVKDGAVIVARRIWEAKSQSRYQRVMNELERTKDWERLAEWECKAEAAKQARHNRRMDRVKNRKETYKAVATRITVVILALIALGGLLAIAGQDPSLILAPLMAIIHTITWTYWLVTSFFMVITCAVITGALMWLWTLGRKVAAPAAEWSDPVQRTERGQVVNITPSIVVAALRDLGIRKLRDYIKSDPDAGERMLGMITRLGDGAQVDVTLPPEVTVSMVMKVRETLAGNLDRKTHEVHIECSPDSERVLTLWVADSGALDKRVPPSPLLDEDFGPVDIYRDLMPWGLGLKADQIELNLLQQHFLLAGLSKQGKTAAARAIVLWLALDPTTRIRIADLKGFGDWSMFEGLAEVLIEGAGHENFIATCDMLEDAVREMERRYEKWRAMGRKGDIDRASSQVGSGFEPYFVVIDEVQKLYTCSTEHPDGGEIGGNSKKSRAARAAQALHDQARAVNIHLIQFAQNPTDRNLPVLVREGAMIRASLYVAKETIAKMALGDAPVDTGAAPHALRSGLDRGTVVLAPGESMDLPGGGTHTTVRTHYISTQDAYTIAERAKKLRTNHRAAPPEERDLLADVLQECGEEDAPRAADLAVRLRKLAPGYHPYQELTGEALTEALEALGVKRGSKGGIVLVRTERVRYAMAEREMTDDED